MTIPRADGDRASPTVLLVEDEPDLNELLAFGLINDGYDVRSAASGEEALRLLDDEVPDLIVLDLMLPGVDGLEVCRRVRKQRRTADVPVIMLTARGEESDIVRGLELGADDYITKPFSAKVLHARVKAVLRRRGEPGAGSGASATRLSVQNVVVDTERHEATVDGGPIELTATEFRLLTLLMARPGRVFTRQGILERLHDGLAAVTDRSVDVQVVALRRKLGDAGGLIETVRGVGYRFKD